VILSKKVEVKIVGKNINHYKTHGYNCSVNDIIWVDVEHLTQGSHIKVEVQCSICGHIKQLSYKNYLKNKGVRYYTCSEKCAISKNKETNMAKFGFENPFQNPEIKSKSKKTYFENTGFENPSLNPDVIAEKVKNYKQKTGFDYPLQNPEVQTKIKETFIRNGYEHPMYDHHIKEKTLQRRREAGYDNNKQKELSRLNFLKYGYELVESNDTNVTLTNISGCGHKFKINRTTFFSRHKIKSNICTICNNVAKKTSGQEQELIDWIRSLGLLCSNDRNVIAPYELDIYIPSHNIAIEYNGLYWHSEVYKGSGYHLNKTILCEEKGIQLLHIFEDDWLHRKEIVKSIIRNRLSLSRDTKIYARKCDIRHVPPKDAKLFLDENHIQGSSNSTTKLGLYHKDELVSLMTFGYRHTNAKKELELIRFCTKLHHNVYGAASKLFQHYVRNYNFSYLISYADKSLFNGKMYNMLGFEKISLSKPNYFWIVDGIRYHRFTFNKQKLIKMGFDANKTEVEIMHEQGYYRIWSCGQIRYEYKT
jgi:uncharacterized protein YlaI